MKKILLLFLIVGLAFSMSAQQQIDLIGVGINGESGANLEVDPDLTNVTSVHLGVVYKDVFGIDPVGDVQFTDDDNDFTASFVDVDEERSNGDYAHVGTFTTDFVGAGPTGENAFILDLTHDINYVQSFYAFVYRTIPDATYYSVANLTTVFFYHNGSINPYEFHMPITPVDASRNVTVKVPVSELDETGRMVIIDISYDDGNGNSHFESHEETTWDAEASFFLGNYLLPDVPGTVSNILVSIYSPNPLGDSDENGNPMNGDSFVVTGVVVDVDNVPPPDDPEDPEDPECAECEGQITYLELEYLGSSTANITVYEGRIHPNKIIDEFDGIGTNETFSFVGMRNHGKMGAKILLTIEGEDGSTEIHTSCSEDIYIGMTYDGLYTIIDGTSHDGGKLCEMPEGDPDPDPDPDPECAECEGQITYLDLKYTGSSEADIKVYEGKVQPNKLMYEFDNVQPNGNFSFVGLKNHGKMGAKIRLTIEGESGYIEIHTSCSQDIYIGSTYEGTYEILDGTSHDGGPLCVDPNKSSSITLNELKDMVIYPNPMSSMGTIEYVATNDGQSTVEIYNIMGQKVGVLFSGRVFADNRYQVSLDANSFSKGMYIVVITNESTTYKQKLFIAR